MTAPQPPAADDLVEWLNAIDEESMYERPATTKATIDQAAARIQSDAARIAALEARVKVLEEVVREAANGLEAANTLILALSGKRSIMVETFQERLAASAALGDRHD